MRALARKKSHNKFLVSLLGTTHFLLILIKITLSCFGYSVVLFYLDNFLYFCLLGCFLMTFCLCFLSSLVGLKFLYAYIGSRAISIRS